MSTPFTAPHPSAGSSELSQFSRAISPLNLMPLWERTARMKPGTSCVPALWRYADIRPQLLRAAALIFKGDAERRVLVLENPSLRGTTFITSTLYAGVQIIMPGETAPSHRHSPSALRFVIEGEGAYTAIEGKRVRMHPGDFIVTPNWAWHEHGNTGTAPVVWMDGLDTPFAAFLGAMFREEDPAGDRRSTAARSRPEGDAEARYGAGMLPPHLRALAGQSAPLLTYPYARSREALARLARGGPAHPVHGYRLRYANPATGGLPFPTLAVFLQWLPKGFAGTLYRSTEGVVFSVVEGRGRLSCAQQEFSWSHRDIFVVPPWGPYRLAADEDSVLFSFSDRTAQEALGFWREVLP